MGTRNLTIVKMGEKVHGQYGQWDGYPSGNGLLILNFLQDQFHEESFRAGFEKTKFVKDEDVESSYSRLGGSGEKNPMSREMGVGILSYLQTAENPEVYNQLAFAADSLFCEWAYMIDLDQKKLRVFKGFNKTKLADTEFFAKMAGSGGYQPIAEIGELTFDEIGTISKEDFLAKFNDKDEE